MTLSTLKIAREDKFVRKELHATGELHIYTCISNLRPSDFLGLSQIKALTIGPDLHEARRQPTKGSSVEEISIPSFLFSELKGLQQLNIWMKGVTHIEAKAFSGLNSLKSLNLSQNKIKLIERDAFSGLDNLTNLNLGDNCIESIEGVPLSPLASLLILSLNGNRIQNIDAGAFYEIPNLINLELGRNQIRTLSSSAFRGLEKLSSLHLEGNPIKVVPRALEKLGEHTQVTLSLRRKGTISCALRELLGSHYKL